MRTIKFRVYDTANKKMYSVDELGNLWSAGIPVATHQSMDDKHDIHLRIDKNPLMQFTGLLDKNGKEIYEGDIMQDWRGDRGNVSFYNGSFRAFSASGTKLQNPMKIIGNVWENTDLLNNPQS